MGKTVKMNRYQTKLQVSVARLEKHDYTDIGYLRNPLVLSRFHYRPQTKLRKGNVFTPVCQSFCSRGGGISACTGQTPPRADTPAPGQTPPTPPGRHPPGRQPPAATTADGTHSTGMHSCSYYFIYSLIFDTLEEKQFSQEYNCSIENTNWTNILHTDFQFCLIYKGFTQRTKVRILVENCKILEIMYIQVSFIICVFPSLN